MVFTLRMANYNTNICMRFFIADTWKRNTTNNQYYNSGPRLNVFMYLIDKNLYDSISDNMLQLYLLYAQFFPADVLIIIFTTIKRCVYPVDRSW